MVDACRGQLVALDGSMGKVVSDLASTLCDALMERGQSCGISRWDASGLFGDVVSAPSDQRDVSPRTLVLLYAADLAFRIRWEIGPALEQGMMVLAAPYTLTAISFGVAAGLPNDWLRALFRFAAAPARTLVLRESGLRKAWKRRPDRGFAECCTTLLDATPEGFSRRKAHAVMHGALATASEKHGGLVRTRDLGRIAAELATPERSRRTR